MWILPNNYRPSSRSARDTVASREDLASPALDIESSLMWKSKPTPLRTWLAKWKQDNWIRRLYGRILRPSQWACFEEQWTYLLQDTRASRFLQQAAAGGTRTLDTYGPTLARLSGSYDPDAFSLRMWTATLVSDLTKSSPTWRRMITERRGAYSRRLKSGPPTNGNESTSWAPDGNRWPSPVASTGGPGKDPKNPRGRMQGNALASAVRMEPPANWPTVRASEYKDCGPVGSKSQVHMDKRSYLCAKVKDPEQPKGSLNPDWVEWLMGLPAGWTELDAMATPHSGWGVEPPIPRVVLGAADRVDRIRLLGNGVVPQTAALAWETLSKELEV